MLRFFSIGIAGLSSWLAAKYAGSTEPGTAPTAPEPPVSTALDPLASITSEPLAPIVVGLGIVILGLVIERVLVYAKK